jgi:hypothetical protein
MRIIELDASACQTPKQFAAALREAIEAIPGHGSSVESFVDSMIYGTMSDMSPPYTVRVTGLQGGEVEKFAHRLAEALGQARLERRTRKGEDIEVSLRIVR